MKFNFATVFVAALPAIQGALPCLAAAIAPRDSISAYAYAEGDVNYDKCPGYPYPSPPHTTTYTHHTTYTHTTTHTTTYHTPTYHTPTPTTHSTTHSTTPTRKPTTTHAPPPKPTKTTTIVVTTTAPAPSGSQCSTGPVQCCNSVESSSSEAASKQLGLLGIVLQGLDIPVGITCSPIDVLSIASGSGCTAQTVCCENNNFNGLINLGCNAISL
ncbi:hydrophobin-domain-containing protein [Schizopora paradoxa]|uniref:Hydrophobin n=1 Tax=Schizopora paradoxa TaxID=27342 RepID=A0A0H2RL83_9AGAM|nr:hydrophobin-domain-containing protein [Schizopora paradoxa]